MSITIHVWTDIETSGLDHTEDALLEIGAVVTDADLDPIVEYQRCTRLPDNWPRYDRDAWPLAPEVRAMHTANGLLYDVYSARRAPDEDDLVDDFLDWCRFQQQQSTADRVILAGSGVATFDLPWLHTRSDPRGDWPFHYRVLDLSPARTLLGMAGITTHLDASSGPGKAHRALADARAHLAEARLIRDTLLRLRRADIAMGRLIDAQDGPHAQPPGGEL